VKEGFYCQGNARLGFGLGHAFSKDPGSGSCFSADGQNEKCASYCARRWRRFELRDGGRQPGQFYGVNSMPAIPRATSIRPRPTRQRVQKFVYKGIARSGQANRGCSGPVERRCTARSPRSSVFVPLAGWRRTFPSKPGPHRRAFPRAEAPHTYPHHGAEARGDLGAARDRREPAGASGHIGAASSQVRARRHSSVLSSTASRPRRRRQFAPVSLSASPSRHANPKVAAADIRG